MSSFIVGVTGGIASGKTSVTDEFVKLGIDVIDADVVAREVVEVGTPAFEKIRQRFGQEIATDAGLDRAKLRTLVFESEEEKRWLNQLLHPTIREEMKRQCQLATSPYCILSIPLLIENSLQPLVNRILVIDVDEEVQLQRALQRDGSERHIIENIMKAQVNRKARLEAADDVIDNSGSLQALTAQVSRLNELYLSLCSQ